MKSSSVERSSVYDRIRVEISGIRSDLDDPVSVLGELPEAHGGIAHGGGAAVLCGGESIHPVAADKKGSGSPVSGVCLRCGVILAGREPWGEVSAKIREHDDLVNALWERHSTNHSVRYMTKWDFEQALNEAISHLKRT